MSTIIKARTKTMYRSHHCLVVLSIAPRRASAESRKSPAAQERHTYCQRVRLLAYNCDMDLATQPNGCTIHVPADDLMASASNGLTRTKVRNELREPHTRDLTPRETGEYRQSFSYHVGQDPLLLVFATLHL